jgi:hypothetical protein
MVESGYRRITDPEPSLNPPPVKEITVPEMFRRFGAAGWDALGTRFRATPTRDAAE